MGTKTATIREVAAAAQVSVSTVSRVLNAKPDVAAPLQARVLAAIRDLHYTPNGSARSLRTQATKVLGLVVPDIANPFFTLLVRGMEDVASAGGYSLLLANTDEDVAKERNYANVAVAENLAGVVVAPASSDSAHLARLVDLGIPLVVVDRRVDGLVVDSVTVDNFVAGYKATHHLLDGGYRHIGLISGPLSAMTAIDRKRGYAAALHDAGVEADPELTVVGDFRVEGGRAGARLLRDRGGFDAVVVGNNLMTVGAIEALGIEADPALNRFGFVGFGEREWLGMLRPDIDVIIQPTYEIGRQCGELLLRRIEFPDAPVIDVVLQVELRLRAV